VRDAPDKRIRHIEFFDLPKNISGRIRRVGLPRQHPTGGLPIVRCDAKSSLASFAQNSECERPPRYIRRLEAASVQRAHDVEPARKEHRATACPFQSRARSYAPFDWTGTVDRTDTHGLPLHRKAELSGTTVP
jgi:hypothetical protein